MSVEACPKTSFKVADFLSSRSISPNYVMIELGHRAIPIVINDNNTLAGNRAYIGVEAWLRDTAGNCRRMIAELAIKKAGQNVFFVNQPIGGEAMPPYDGGTSVEYTGEYTPETILPDGCADELIIGNVFGDPHISSSLNRTRALLNEAKRLINDDGIIVIRETITPSLCRLNNTELENCGLYSISRVTEDESDEWYTLENIYNADTDLRRKNSFYLFLAKTTK